MINGKTLRQIIEADASLYVACQNYPIQVDLIDNKIIITIQEDSSIYSEIKNGMNFSMEDLLFETETKLSTRKFYLVSDNEFVENTPVVGISVLNMKTTYFAGADIDLSKIIAYTILSDDSQGERIEVTADMLSGYDKNTVGKQTVTLNAFGFTETFEIEVVANDTNGEETPSEPSSGCGSVINRDGGDFAVISFSVLVFALGLIALRKKKEEE